MGVDCYLARKKKGLANIEFVELDRLYFFQDEFSGDVLHPIKEFYKRIYKLQNTFPDDAAYEDKKESQLYWLQVALYAAPPEYDYAGIISEHIYQLYHDNVMEIKIDE